MAHDTQKPPCLIVGSLADAANWQTGKASIYYLDHVSVHQNLSFAVHFPNIQRLETNWQF